MSARSSLRETAVGNPGARDTRHPHPDRGHHRHQVQGLAVHNDHQGMIGRAGESIERLSKAQRHLSALTVTIPAEQVPTLKAEINASQERLLDLCDSSEADAEQVYQLNMQLFPLSKRL